MASLIYNQGKLDIFNQNIDMLNDTIKVALVTAAYTPDKDAHQYFDDITNEIAGTGYTAGGETLGTKAIDGDDANDRAEFDAADVTWSVATFTCRAGILYKDTGTPSTSPLIAYIDFGQDISPSAADFSILWDAEGIIYLGE